jgi:hypothetical protein
MFSVESSLYIPAPIFHTMELQVELELELEMIVFLPSVLTSFSSLSSSPLLLSLT